MSFIKSMQPWVKLLLKILVTAVCLWYVSRKIDWAESLLIIRQGNMLWLLAATLLFVASKVVSSIRLNIYFGNINVHLSQKSNLQLYWLGMFYNLFLPGGIGGDAYKIILLNRTYNCPAKQLTAAVLLDRLSGVAGLGILAVVYYYALFAGSTVAILLLVAVIPGLFVYYVMIKKLFPSFIQSFWGTLWLGIAVQALQVLCAYSIMQALNITGHQTAYIFIFLVSSIVAILPFTIGGLGAREVVFLWGSKTLLHVDKDPSPVSISISFYLITLSISLIGIYWIYKEPVKTPARARESQ